MKMMNGIVLTMGLTALALNTNALSTNQWERFDLTSAATTNGAVCLDGSAGGGFIRRGDPKRWLIFHNGFDWCGSDADCLSKSKTSFGSSTKWPSYFDDTYDGSALFATAPFDNFTIVFAKACDGGSWTGDAAQPVTVAAGEMIYYRGKRLLDAMIDYALGEGLSDADELMYAGCAAGALTAFVHGDYVAGRMPVNVNTVIFGDGMYTLDHQSFLNTSLLAPVMQFGYEAWNASGSIDQDCIKNMGSLGWKCLFGATVVPYITTPTFVLNSKYDTWQESSIIGLKCIITDCTLVQQSFWVDYGHLLTIEAQKLPSQHGVFLTNCPAHCQSGISNFVIASIDGTSISNAVVTWYQSHNPSKKSGASSNPSGASVASQYKFIETCDLNVCSGDTC